MASSSLWQRFQRYFLEYRDLGFSLDLSRMKFPDDLFEKMRPQIEHASGLRLQRGEDGWLGFERTFRFEYSYDGSDRHVGRLVLRGRKLVSFAGPVRRENVVQLH